MIIIYYPLGIMSRRNSIVGNGPMLNRKASIAALQKSNSVQYDQMPAELMQIAVDIKTVDMVCLFAPIPLDYIL